MRNACLEHFPGWDDGDQAQSFVTLIAHLSRSWSEASLFSKGDFGLLRMDFLRTVRHIACLVLTLSGNRPSAYIESLSRKDPAHAGIVQDTVPAAWTGLYGRPWGDCS